VGGGRTHVAGTDHRDLRFSHCRVSVVSPFR
jgi:hypothetical protein